VIALFMALLSSRGISTPSLPAQGKQRRFSFFNIRRGISATVQPPRSTMQGLLPVATGPCG
jgi:hypothetical protein